MKQSAGTLLYRICEELEVLLVHASGGYNRNKPWGIPKGLPDDGESLEQAARRETLEETGVCAGELSTLGHIDYMRRRKRIHAFAGRAPDDAAPTCASWEVDRAEFVTFEAAMTLIHPDQRLFLERLEQLLEQPPGRSVLTSIITWVGSRHPATSSAAVSSWVPFGIGSLASVPHMSQSHAGRRPLSATRGAPRPCRRRLGRHAL